MLSGLPFSYFTRHPAERQGLRRRKTGHRRLLHFEEESPQSTGPVTGPWSYMEENRICKKNSGVTPRRRTRYQPSVVVFFKIKQL
jgi:hypothetical protein